MRPAHLLAALALAAGCGGDDDGGERERAIAAARAAYEEAAAEGRDFADGPCLGVVHPNWVADVAHDPRQDVDDRPENQCEAYRSGEAEHFVELDPDGNLIRAE
jgi:catechol 2,3-dioxygenase-like lactoylglutathione lyase family enzyme